MVELEFLQYCPFWAYIKKFNTFNFWVHRHHSSWSTFDVHVGRGPKAFVNWFFEKSDHGSWTIKSDYKKKAIFPCSDIMVHGGNRPLDRASECFEVARNFANSWLGRWKEKEISWRAQWGAGLVMAGADAESGCQKVYVLWRTYFYEWPLLHLLFEWDRMRAVVYTV